MLAWWPVPNPHDGSMTITDRCLRAGQIPRWRDDDVADADGGQRGLTPAGPVSVFDLERSDREIVRACKRFQRLARRLTRLTRVVEDSPLEIVGIVDRGRIRAVEFSGNEIAQRHIVGRESNG